MLPSENKQVKHAVEKVCTSHYSFGLQSLKLRLLDHSVEDLEWFESIPSKSRRLFGCFTVLIEQLHRTTSRKLGT